MVEYQKYMFDNFVVEINKDKDIETEILPELEKNESIADCETFDENSSDVVSETNNDDLPTENYDISADEITAEEQSETISFSDAEITIDSEKIADVTFVSEIEPEKTFEEEQADNTPEIIEPSYSEEELKEAVRQAEEAAYSKGFQAASDDISEKHNLLLGDIKNQLMTIYAEIENKKSEIETSSLKFALGVIRKVLPTLEHERAEAEVKSFLADNFANFAAQESLSFSFNPETVSLVAESIGRLAEQNDFEGKIAVHKDASLGVSDCRVEWKSGGVERSMTKTLEKIEHLIENN